nr:cobyric acid synthase [Lachnospiraceae bacterium]
YFAYKKELIPVIKEAFRKLEEIADIIVIEGAGSPAEINLKENDIVNMGMAKIVDAPVLLAGDIDRGGVFAQLLGTLMLLEDDEKDRIKGLIINKFRGDKTILDPGIDMLVEKGNVPVVGVLPYMNVCLEDEDSLSDRFNARKHKFIDIAVVRFPRISNFTDYNIFEQNENVSVRYVKTPEELEGADMIILPGSKNTMGDLLWMRQNGIEAMIKKSVGKAIIFGICGGFQMLGESISDPDGVEEGGSARGLGLLPTNTVLKNTKTRLQKRGKINEVEGILKNFSNLEYEGYEIHMGETYIKCSDTERSLRGENANLDSERTAGKNVSDALDSKKNVFVETSDNSDLGKDKSEVIENVLIYDKDKNVYGTYLHGIFDRKEIAEEVIRTIASKKGIEGLETELTDYAAFKEKEYEKMADILREHLNMEEIYGMLREARID